MRVGVKILPRNEVLDIQGRAVARTLKQNGKNISGCRVGKYVELEIEAQEEKEALDQAKEMAEFVLHNSLTESYELEVLS